MLKRFLLAALIAIPALLGAQNVKIGVIDTDAIITAMPEAKEADNKLADISKKFEAEFQNLNKEYNTKVEEFQKLPETELQTIKDRKARDIEDTQTRIMQFQQQAREELQKQQATLFAPIQQKIMDAIESVGKEGGFTIIQEKGALLFYAAPAQDITPLVKTKLGI